MQVGQCAGSHPWNLDALGVTPVVAAQRVRCGSGRILSVGETLMCITHHPIASGELQRAATNMHETEIQILKIHAKRKVHGDWPIRFAS